MPLDHSRTYKTIKFKNLPHIMRLKSITKVLRKNTSFFDKKKYLDVGCSNGYLTELIGSNFNFIEIHGKDHEPANLKIGRKEYPNIQFDFIDLNVFTPSFNKYDLITCFETLEHVGHLENSISSILSFMEEKKSTVLISVPIEIGPVGILKFIIKTIFFNYTLSELSGHVSRFSYFTSLVKNQNISQYRDQRNGWGTHFGFDYRNIDHIFKSKQIKFKAWNKYTTRYYLIKTE